jgi:hypothetical protein
MRCTQERQLVVRSLLRTIDAVEHSLSFLERLIASEVVRPSQTDPQPTTQPATHSA